MQFDKDLASPHQALFLQVRKYLLAFEGIVETKKQRITTYAYANSGICHLRTTPYGVDVGFLKGSKMTDKPGLLAGKGKAVRVLSLQSMDTKVLDYYLQQAINFNTQKP